MATTVWIVDDEEAVRDALEAMVRELGYTCRTFGKAEDVLTAYQGEAPDIVITDVRMPGMSGIDLTRAIREMDPAALVMVLTAYASIPIAVEAIQGGAVDFLSKPCNVEELRLRLQRALETKILQSKLKKTQMLAWALIGSLPIWFILGMLLAKLLLI